MTPTEQDKELREKIHSALFADDFPILNDIEKDAVDRIVAIIQAQKTDRKRVALEARIDEINYLDDNFQADSQDWEREHPGYSTAMIPMEDYIRRRTELKAQQEEV